MLDPNPAPTGTSPKNEESKNQPGSGGTSPAPNPNKANLNFDKIVIPPTLTMKGGGNLEELRVVIDCQGRESSKSAAERTTAGMRNLVSKIPVVGEPIAKGLDWLGKLWPDTPAAARIKAVTSSLLFAFGGVLATTGTFWLSKKVGMGALFLARPFSKVFSSVGRGIGKTARFLGTPFTSAASKVGAKLVSLASNSAVRKTLSVGGRVFSVATRPFSKAFSSVGHGIGILGRGIGKTARFLGTPFTSAASKIGARLGSLASNNAVRKTLSVGGRALAVGGRVFSVVGRVVPVIGIALLGYSLIKGIWSLATDKIPNFLADVKKEGLGGAIKIAGNSMKTSMGNFGRSVKDTVVSLPSHIRSTPSYAKNAWNNLKSAGSTISSIVTGNPINRNLDALGKCEDGIFTPNERDDQLTNGEEILITRSMDRLKNSQNVTECRKQYLREKAEVFSALNLPSKGLTSASPSLPKDISSLKMENS